MSAHPYSKKELIGCVKHCREVTRMSTEESDTKVEKDNRLLTLETVFSAIQPQIQSREIRVSVDGAITTRSVYKLFLGDI